MTATPSQILPVAFKGRWQYQRTASTLKRRHGPDLQTTNSSLKKEVMKKISAVEWAAAAFGIAGALLMAAMGSPALAFALFLVSNVAWLVFAGRRGHWGLFAQQCLFLLSSLLGLWNWWLGPLVLG